jgi:CubicO group peptidase (beta-lactamase class C family)
MVLYSHARIESGQRRNGGIEHRAAKQGALAGFRLRCAAATVLLLIGPSAAEAQGFPQGTFLRNPSVDQRTAPAREPEYDQDSRRFEGLIADDLGAWSGAEEPVSAGFLTGFPEGAPPADGPAGGIGSVTLGPPSPVEFEFGPDTAWWWFARASEAEIVARLDEGFRLVDLEVVEANPIRFAAVLVRNTGAYAKTWWWYFDRTEAEIRDLAALHDARLIRVQPYDSGAGLRFAAIMVRETGQDNTTWGWLSATTIENVRDRVYNRNARIIDIEPYEVGGILRYSALLDNAITGGPNAVLTHANVAGIGAWMADNPDYKLVDLERSPTGGWVAIAARDPGLSYWWWYLDVSAADILHLTGRHHARIVDIEVRQTSGGLRYDIAMTNNGLPQQGVGTAFAGRDEYDRRLRDFVKRRGIPGLGMALVKDGRLVYAQSYGLARTAPVELATARTLFRIGSNSKIAAAVAILQLIEAGVSTPAGQPVTMDTRIFRDILNGPSGVGNALGTYNSQLDQVTVRQVLQHIAGFGGINPIINTEQIAVALGLERTPTCPETVRWILDRPLAAPPMTTWDYYNTGPCIIAAAVEVLTGQSFEAYIRDNMFAPYGLENLIVRSADLFADRVEGEAEHYSTIGERLSGSEFVPPKYLELVPSWPGGVPNYDGLLVRRPYGGIPLVNGTAPGGLAATPAAYARFLAGVSGSDCVPLISQTSFDTRLTATSAFKNDYGAFVAVNQANGDVYHNGAVAGGHGWYVMKTADDVIWTVFANSSDDNDLNELNQIMIAAYNAAKPAIDASTADHFPDLGIKPVAPVCASAIWRHTGTPCSGDSCPGWIRLDNNPRTVSVAAGNSLYQLHSDGAMWRHTGTPCTGDSCPGWVRLDNNPMSIAIAASGPHLFQLHRDGAIWRHTGTPCTGDSCPGWVRLDNNPMSIAIAVDGSNLYQLHRDGAIWRHTGTPCSGNSCPGWVRLDNNPMGVAIAAAGGNLYQLHRDGAIWRHTGTPCSGNSCPGWVRLDNNPMSIAIAADGSNLYQLHRDGAIWRHTGTLCTGNSCPGWVRLDNNPMGVAIAASGGNLYQLHRDGAIWRHTGTPCSGNSCPGWVRLDNNPRTNAIAAAGGDLYQLHASGLAQRHQGGWIWQATGHACDDDGCGGWQLLDNNPSTVEIEAGAGWLYQLHQNGRIWRSTGAPCQGNSCSGWQMLDNNPATRAIAAGDGQLYQLHAGGRIWRSTGSPCEGNSCPGWQMLDNNPQTAAIAAAGGQLYQLHDNGRIWRSTGAPCQGDSCPGWQMLDNNPATRAIAAGGGHLYQLHADGRIWRSTGVPCQGNSCPGWQMLDDNPRTRAITAAGGQLYQMHDNGQIWRSTGVPCQGQGCPGWQILDNNPQTRSIVAHRAE